LIRRTQSLFPRQSLAELASPFLCFQVNFWISTFCPTRGKSLPSFGGKDPGMVQACFFPPPACNFLYLAYLPWRFLTSWLFRWPLVSSSSQELGSGLENQNRGIPDVHWGCPVVISPCGMTSPSINQTFPRFFCLFSLLFQRPHAILP